MTLTKIAILLPFLLSSLPTAKTAFSPSFYFSKKNNLEPEAWQQDMLNRVNLLRSKGCHCGRRYMPPVPPLVWNDQLEKSAATQVQDMYRHHFISHRGSNGSSPGKRVTKTGYQWHTVGENAASGQESVEEVMQDWKKSSTHCLIMMDKSYRDFGAALQGAYWVQVFASPLK